MSFRSPHATGGPDLADSLTPGVRAVLIVSGLVFLAQTVLPSLRMVPPGWLEQTFGLVPADVFGRFHLWQPATYLFLHGGLFHLLFNMFGLWMFGAELERNWGTRAFLAYYFVTGIGAGLFSWLLAMNSQIPTIGASGAIFGILLAFGMLFPDRPILLYFVLPVPARYVVILYAFIEIVAVAGGRQDGVARFAHLGGLLVGFVYLKSERLAYPIRRWWGTRRRRALAREEERSTRRMEAEQERKDAILEKISRQGMGSLSRDERAFLEDAARRGREGRR